MGLLLSGWAYYRDYFIRTVTWNFNPVFKLLSTRTLIRTFFKTLAVCRSFFGGRNKSCSLMIWSGWKMTGLEDSATHEVSINRGSIAASVSFLKVVEARLLKTWYKQRQIRINSWWTFDCRRQKKGKRVWIFNVALILVFLANQTFHLHE